MIALPSLVDYSPFDADERSGLRSDSARGVDVTGRSLPLGEPPRKERADAARNRAAILAAAEKLFAAHGVDGVSMDALAAEAGVGKGTLFRRFGDKAGLARALLDERERELQEAILHGPPPLGPDAPPCERLIAFGRAFLEFPDDHRAILVAADAAGAARY